MSSGDSPLVQEQRAYRRRRLVDTARLLPVAGVILVCLPLLWAGESGQAMSTTYMMIYLFSLWLALISGVVLLSRHLRVEDESTDPDRDAEAQEGDEVAQAAGSDHHSGPARGT